MAKRERNSSDLDFEIQFCEGVLAKNEKFLPALILLGDLYTRRGLFEKGLGVDETLSRLMPEDGVVFYNLACSYSLLGRIEDALTTMKTAIALGYNDFKHMGQDRDLENLFKDNRFRDYLTRLKEKTIPVK